MSIADRVRAITEELSEDKQAEVLDFVEFIRSRAARNSAELAQREAHEKARLRSERFGALRGAFQIADDFDAPLPEDILRDFEGG